MYDLEIGKKIQTTYIQVNYFQSKAFQYYNTFCELKVFGLGQLGEVGLLRRIF